MIANDGGLYETYDNFADVPSLHEPAAVAVLPDRHRQLASVLRICGGAQDNGTICGPSRTLNRAGIRTSDWYTVGGGDGFQARVDPRGSEHRLRAIAERVAVAPRPANRPERRRSGRAAPNTQRAAVATAAAGRGGRAAARRWRQAIRPLALGRAADHQPAFITPSLLRRREAVSQRQPRRFLDGDQPGPDAASSTATKIPIMGKVWPRGLGRLHPGDDDAEHDHDDRRIAAARGAAHRRHRRRAGADHRRRRKELAQGRAVPGCPAIQLRHRRLRVAAQCGHAVRHDQQLSARRLQALRDEEHGPRPARGRRSPAICRRVRERGRSSRITSTATCCSPGSSSVSTSPSTAARTGRSCKGGHPDDAGARPRDPEARERSGRRLVRPRRVHARRLHGAARRDRASADQEAALFQLRDAYLFDELGQVRAAWGDPATPNPPFGAVFTYNVGKPAAAGTSLVLVVSDDTGKQVRRLDLSNGPGVHRMAWNLRAKRRRRRAQGGGREWRRTRRPAAAAGAARALSRDDREDDRRDRQPDRIFAVFNVVPLVR